MGVTGLWQILHPYAVPIKLETLNRKRLAVDASIWIYQFLKAVRDKEGNALRNSHVVGFYRRICKLLFFGIKPVFVFDGGAPALKRQTVSERKKRREGRREDAVRTAGRLLAVQMQRRAEEEEQKRKAARHQTAEEEEVPDEALVYADENLMTQQERQQNRTFRKKDAYHLPELDVSLNEMGQPNDPRIMSLEELQSYARQFEAGEDINVYDFSKIDYDSAFFMSLPASDRYNILNAARLRSRLRMGHSKEQLDSMFPDRMAFSKFQIERVRERNELTQRLMHLNEGGDELFNTASRVAGEKGREYVLVKNDGVEGGWALGVISDEGTKQETAIDLDKPAPVVKHEDDEWEDDDDFEDVPIEGLNRLPKRPKPDVNGPSGLTKQRQAFYKSRRAGARRKAKPATDPNSLFVADEPEADEGQDWEEVDGNAELFGEDEENDEELQRAIAMSLQNEEQTAPHADGSEDADGHSAPSDDDMLEVFRQSAVPEARPLPKGSGRAIASIVNKRAFDVAPESREVTSFGVPAPRSDESDQDDDTVDLQAALAESRRTKRKITLPVQRRQPPAFKQADPATEVAKKAGFSGPLPFEKLDLGSSLLGKKKMQERSEEAAGGFENPELAQKEQKTADPLPPWFSGSLEEDIQKQRDLETEDRQRAREFNKQFEFQGRGERTLGKQQTTEVIDLEAEENQDQVRNGDVIDLEADGYDETTVGGRGFVYDPQIRMGDLADKARAEPPIGEQENRVIASSPKVSPHVEAQSNDMLQDHDETIDDGTAEKQSSQSAGETANRDNEDEEMLDWSESDIESPRTSKMKATGEDESTSNTRQSRSPSMEFEDVSMPEKPTLLQQYEDAVDEGDLTAALESTHQDPMVDEDLDQEDFDDFSDPEDEQLLLQLAKEAEEHARFASTLNNKSQAQNIADYEKELKQLRNQQKKDRRDADEVTHIMITECQQLLRLFGLPYVTAPMEAEAQCAELVRLGLVDGIVTDDSDCFLFGGNRVYKNMFNQAKLVECYLSSDLEKAGWPRDKLVQAAHILGSDYTEGLPGIGPVGAAEILGEFQTLDEFKEWWNGVQMNKIPKSEDSGNPVRKKLRKQSTKLFLPPIFPDVRVDVAYTNPDVDKDAEPFQWGVPDLDALRSFLMATIGWSQERTDEVLVPVIRDMNRRMDEGTQSNITAFFDGGVGIGAAGAANGNSRSEAFAPRKKAAESSKRMGSALGRMAEKAKLRRGDVANDGSIPGANEEIGSSSAKKKTTKGSKRKTNELSEDDETSEFEAPRKKTRRRAASARPSKGRKQKTQAES
jgi:DNA excision repair protein ERCC-5